MSSRRLIRVSSRGTLALALALSACGNEEVARWEAERAAQHAAAIRNLLSADHSAPTIRASFPHPQFSGVQAAQEQIPPGFSSGSEPFRLQSLLEYDYEAGIAASRERSAQRQELEHLLLFPPLFPSLSGVSDLNAFRSDADKARQSSLVNLRLALGFHQRQLADIRRQIATAEKLKEREAQAQLLRSKEEHLLREIAGIERELSDISAVEEKWMLSLMPGTTVPPAKDLPPFPAKSPIQRKEDLQIESFYKSWEVLSQPRPRPVRGPSDDLNQKILRTILSVQKGSNR